MDGQRLEVFVGTSNSSLVPSPDGGYTLQSFEQSTCLRLGVRLALTGASGELVQPKLLQRIHLCCKRMVDRINMDRRSLGSLQPAQIPKKTCVRIDEVLVAPEGFLRRTRPVAVAVCEYLLARLQPKGWSRKRR